MCIGEYCGKHGGDASKRIHRRAPFTTYADDVDLYPTVAFLSSFCPDNTDLEEARIYANANETVTNVSTLYPDATSA